MALIPAFSRLITRFAVWHFDGLDTPALDLVLDEKTPTLRGALAIPSTETTSVLGTTITTEAPEIEAFYRRQGLTAADLLKMNANDAFDRVPVATIRARTSAPETAKGDTRSQLRGTLTKVTATRTIDNSAVPAEPPP